MSNYSDSSIPRKGKSGEFSFTDVTENHAIPSYSGWILVFNPYTFTIYIAVGASDIEATAVVDDPVYPGASREFRIQLSDTHFALIATSGNSGNMPLSGIQKV